MRVCCYYAISASSVVIKVGMALKDHKDYTIISCCRHTSGNYKGEWFSFLWWLPIYWCQMDFDLLRSKREWCHRQTLLCSIRKNPYQKETSNNNNNNKVTEKEPFIFLDFLSLLLLLLLLLPFFYIWKLISVVDRLGWQPASLSFSSVPNMNAEALCIDE